MDNEEIDWVILNKNDKIVWSGYFSVTHINGGNYIYATDSYGNYLDLYDVIKINLVQFEPNNINSIPVMRLSFYHKDKNYCISQVQKMKNIYKNNFPKQVYVNGDVIEFNYYESNFDILAKFYKRYDI